MPPLLLRGILHKLDMHRLMQVLVVLMKALQLCNKC